MTIIQPPVCAPKVKEFMLKPGYWTKKIRNAEKLILNEEEIIEFNKKSFRKMKSKGYEEWLYDLETYPETITGEELLNTMKTYSCLLYTSDAADEEDSVDLGGRRIIKK